MAYMLSRHAVSYMIVLLLMSLHGSHNVNKSVLPATLLACDFSINLKSTSFGILISALVLTFSNLQVLEGEVTVGSSYIQQ